MNFEIILIAFLLFFVSYSIGYELDGGLKASIVCLETDDHNLKCLQALKESR